MSSLKITTEAIQGYGLTFARGLVLDQLPKMLAAMINEQLTLLAVDVPTAMRWVNANERLLDHVKIADNKAIVNVSQKLGIQVIDDSWVTTDWMLSAIHAKHPRLYSLFMGWPEGRAWCDRQIIDVKQEISRLTSEIQKPPPKPQ